MIKYIFNKYISYMEPSRGAPKASFGRQNGTKGYQKDQIEPKRMPT